MQETWSIIKRKKYPFLIFISVTVIFLILYHKVIFGGYTKLFIDIGCDSVFMVYPNTYIRSLIQSGQLSSGYVLRQGLGAYMPAGWLTMLAPLNWIYLFVDTSHILLANVIVLYAEYLLVALFSYLFLRRLLKHELSCTIGTLVWTFSGYMVLWEQHNFSIALVYFTAVMYFLQCYLEDRKQGIFGVLALCCLALYSYYFFYMAGLFCALYVTGYCVITKKGVKTCAKKILGLAVAGVLSGAMAAVIIIPELRKFLISARTDVSEQSVQGIFYNVEYLASCIGRFLSNDMFGTGNDFAGYYNYYEAAVLACSVLAVPAIVILLRTKYKRIVTTISVISIVLLAMPAASYVFTLDARKPRWTFMLIFLMALAIGFMVDNLLEQSVSVRIRDIFIIAGIYMALFMLLFWADRNGVVDVRREPAIYICVFVLLYCVLLMLFSRRAVPVLMTVAVMLEVVTANYAAVNRRDILSEDEFEQGYYNDGTSEILEYVSGDEAVYRVNKTYDSVFFNDAKVQGYNGLAVYDSTNSKWLVNFYLTMGFSLMNEKIHYIRIPVDRGILNTLLGVKYVVARDGDTVPENYESICTLNGKTLYLNTQALGFGYIYHDKTDAETFAQLSNEGKDIALTQYYFLTDTDDDAVSADGIDVDDVDVNSNLERLRENSAYHVTQDKNKLRLEITNPYESDAMLCVPVVYDTSWRAYVDGEATDCVNINGGLLGIDMAEYGAGEYQITLVYEAGVYRTGGIVSLIACIIYIMCLALYFRKSPKNKK